MRYRLVLALMVLLGLPPARADPQRPRLRDWGIAIGTLAPGPLNAITDVPGVRVGHVTVTAPGPPRPASQLSLRTPTDRLD